MENIIDRINKMEKILNQTEIEIEVFEKALKRFKDHQKKIQELEKYYFSNLWQLDKEEDRKGKIPKNINTGVLSEDGVFNLSVRNREIGIAMIKLGANMIDTRY